MPSKEIYDAVVVGSGPNGLAAAIALARQGLSTCVLEAHPTPGGGMRTTELTLPGFRHDNCATIATTALLSPFMRSLPLEQYGVEWIQPEIPVAHPLDGAPSALVYRSLADTAASLGRDGRAYRRMLEPLALAWQEILADLLGPLPMPPRHPLPLLNFGRWGIQPASLLARTTFRTEPGRALFASFAGHSILPLRRLGTSAFALLLNLGAHAVGWPYVRGGIERLTEALVAILRSLGGIVETNHAVHSLDDLPAARVKLFDVTPRTFLRIAGDRLPSRYRRALLRFQYGPGVCKVDYALSAPIPWRDPQCAAAGTLHIGGTLEEIEAAEAAVWRGEHPEKPFVLLTQPTLFDPDRAPRGQHIAWAYCHVPNGSTMDVSGRIEAQIERFAPGFREVIVQRHVYTAHDMENYNSNYVGGDINSGMQDLRQLFTRPTPQLNPYRTPIPGVYLCSSSTPPGGGIHGMCGYHAARTAWHDCFDTRPQLTPF